MLRAVRWGQVGKRIFVKKTIRPSRSLFKNLVGVPERRRRGRGVDALDPSLARVDSGHLGRRGNRMASPSK